MSTEKLISSIISSTGDGLSEKDVLQIIKECKAHLKDPLTEMEFLKGVCHLINSGHQREQILMILRLALDSPLTHGRDLTS